MTRSRLVVAALCATSALAFAAPVGAAPPGNDDFERAAPIGQPPASVSGTVTEATRQAGEPEHGSRASQTVWFAFTPDRARHVAIRVTEANFSGRLVVYTGPALSDLRPIPGVDPGRAVFDASPGATYWIVVVPENDSPDLRSFRLRLTDAPVLTNDAFARAHPISVPQSVPGTTRGATRELGEPKPVRTTGGTVWYRLRARRTDIVRVDAAGSEETPAMVAAYRGTRITSLRLLASAYGYSHDGDLRFRARRGATYYIAVAGNEADFVLNTSDGSIRGQGITLTVNPGQTVESLRAEGLGVVVATRRDSDLVVELTVNAATQRELGLKSRVLGKLTGRLGWQQRLPANILISAEARAALAGQPEVRMTAVLTRTKTPARNRVLRVPVTLPN